MATTEEREPHLRANSLGFGSVLGLGLAYMSLAPVIYFNMGLMEAEANGPVMPLVFIAVTIAILPTAWSFAALARRRPSAGSALTWVRPSLGNAAGLWAGWLLATLYVTACIIYPAYFAMFFNPILDYFHLTPTFATGIAGGIAATVITGVILARNISLSTKAITIFMIVEAGFVLVFALYTIVYQMLHGGIEDPLAPLNPANAEAGISGLSLALVFGMLSIAGVDSVAPVAEEAHTPKKLIPIATLLITIIPGAFWVITSYGFATAVPVETVVNYVNAGLVTPVYGIAEQYLGPLKILVPLTGMTAVIAAFGASLVCASRLIMSINKQTGAGKGFLRSIHPKTGIPWNTSLVCLGIALVVPIVLGVLLGNNSSNAGAWVGGAFVFFALVSYILVNLANIVLHLREYRSEFSWLLNGAIPALGIVVCGYILYRGFFVAYLGESFALGKSIVIACVGWSVIGLAWAVFRHLQMAPSKTPSVSTSPDIAPEPSDA